MRQVAGKAAAIGAAPPPQPSPGGRRSEGRRQAKARRWLVSALCYLVLSLAGVTMLAPLLWMISTSLKAPGRVLTFPPRWLPTEPVTVQVEGRPREVVEVTHHGHRVRAAIMGVRPEGLVLRELGRDNSKKTPLSLTLSQGERGNASSGRTAGANPAEWVQPDDTRVRRLERWAPHWENYAQAWGALKVESGFFGLLHNADGLLVFYLNSLFVAIMVTLGQVVTCSLAAYAFARLHFPGRDKLFLAYLATLMVPSVVTMIPVFALLRRMSLTDTYWALILPGIFSAYGTFLLRQFFLTLPTELEDAAKIDGAGRLTIYWRIILPLSKPALATLVTFVFLHTWNDFMWPVIVIDDLGKKTLPIGLAHFQTPFLTEWHLLMAASVIVMMPVLVVFVAGQRYFVRGLVLSGLKG